MLSKNATIFKQKYSDIKLQENNINIPNIENPSMLY